MVPNCSQAHALFQDRFKDVQVGSRWFSTLYILSPNFYNHTDVVTQSGAEGAGDNTASIAIAARDGVCRLKHVSDDCFGFNRDNNEVNFNPDASTP